MKTPKKKKKNNKNSNYQQFSINKISTSEKI